MLKVSGFPAVNGTVIADYVSSLLVSLIFWCYGWLRFEALGQPDLLVLLLTTFRASLSAWSSSVIADYVSRPLVSLIFWCYCWLHFEALVSLIFWCYCWLHFEALVSLIFWCYGWLRFEALGQPDLLVLWLTTFRGLWSTWSSGVMADYILRYGPSWVLFIQYCLHGDDE
jgi:hypothetical protein